MRPLLLFGSIGALFFAGSAWAGPSGKTPPATTAATSATATATATPTGTATAAGSSAPIAAEIDATARQLFVDGVAAFERQEYAKAYASLLAAWNVKKHWQIAATLGAAAMQVGKPVEAAGYFTYYGRESPADRKEKAKALLADAAAKVGTVVLTVEPADAVVTVDGVASEVKSGEMVYVEAGTHHTLIAKKGTETAEAEVTLDAGQRKSIDLRIGKSGERSMVLPGIAFGVGGAGLVLGAVTGGLALAKTGELQSKCGSALDCPESLRGQGDTTVALSRASTVGFVVAGVGAAVGVVLLLLPTKPKATASVGLTMGPAYLGVKGAF